MTRLRAWAGSGIVLAVALAASVDTIGAGRQEATTERGRQLFRTHCATCHGTTGRGEGPMALYLRIPPADLTAIAARNRGTFPAEAVHRAIDGRRSVRAHGDSAMPIWGDAFSTSESDAAQRIGALVRYLETLQARPGDE